MAKPDIANWFRGRVANVEQAGEQVLDDARQRGAEYVRDMIRTRGSRDPWVANWDNWPNAHPGRRGSAPGRVASGKMLDAVDSWISPGSTSADGKTRMAFGFTRLREKYFLAQEGGFEHHITGQSVGGMHAIADAAEAIRDEIASELPKYLKGK